MQTLVIYDISDNRKRSKLSKLLFEYGLKRIRYSGFIGDLNFHDRVVLEKEVGKFLSCERDSVYIVPLCGRCARLCRVVSDKPVSLVKPEPLNTLAERHVLSI